jgi:hypothetical protein
MTGKTLGQIKESILTNYKKDFPGEAINGKVFATYVLDRYAKLLYKIYQKAEKK